MITKLNLGSGLPGRWCSGNPVNGTVRMSNQTVLARSTTEFNDG